MNRVKHIGIDLKTYRIILQFQNSKNPLILHFDTPSRRFYFSLITLIVSEMKQRDHSGHVYIRKHEKQLKFLDDALAGSNASGTIDGMWEKIRKAWHYSLPNLEEAAHFKIEGRGEKPPYEKGGKFLYECTEEECDSWANLFGVDDITNKWRYKFNLDSIPLSLDNIQVTFDNLKDIQAWKEYLKQLEKTSTENKEDSSEKPNNQQSISERMNLFGWIKGKRWYVYTTIAVTVVSLFISSLAILNRNLRTVSPTDEIAKSSKPSIAVLPFISLSEDSNQGYFADGMTENIIAALSKIPHLFVISRTSAFTYKGKPTAIQTVSEELGVRYILEGSVQVSDDKLRVTAQLIDSMKDVHIWSGKYDRKMKDVFALQDEIAMRVITELQVELTEGEKVRIWTRGTKSLEAHLEFIQGTYHFFKSNPDDLLQAMRKFEQAILLDPSYAEAYGFLSFVHHFNIHAGRVESYKKAQNDIYEYAQKALELDKYSVMGHLGLGSYYLTQGNFDKCVEYARKAVDLSPNNSMTVRVYGVTLMISGYPEKAIPLFQRSLKLDPKVPTMSYMVLGEAYRILEEYDTAIPYLEKSLNDTPKHMLALLNLAACYIGASRTIEAKKPAKKILEINPNMNVEIFIKRLGHKDKNELKIFSEQLVKAGIPLKPPKS